MKEIFKDIKGYEGLYQISNLGNVKSLSSEGKKGKGNYARKESILKGCVNGSGYLNVVLYKDGRTTSRHIHQLVAISFLNHKPCGFKLVVNHIDLNPLNNNINNLEIVTQRENANRKHLKSTSKYVGVHWCKTKCKWISSIRINGKLKFLGHFNNEHTAHLAYQKELKNI